MCVRRTAEGAVVTVEDDREVMRVRRVRDVCVRVRGLARLQIVDAEHGHTAVAKSGRAIARYGTRCVRFRGEGANLGGRRRSRTRHCNSAGLDTPTAPPSTDPGP